MMFIRFQQGQACFSEHSANNSVHLPFGLSRHLSSLTPTGIWKLLQLMCKSLSLPSAAVLLWLSRNLTHSLLQSAYAFAVLPHNQQQIGKVENWHTVNYRSCSSFHCNTLKKMNTQEVKMY